MLNRNAFDCVTHVTRPRKVTFVSETLLEVLLAMVPSC